MRGWYHPLPSTVHGDPAASAARRTLQDEDSPPRKREPNDRGYYCHYILEFGWRRGRSCEQPQKMSTISHIPRVESRARDVTVTRENARNPQGLATRRDKTHHVGLRCLRIPEETLGTCTVASDVGCVRGDTIRAMDTNATNAVLGANSAITLASSMNDPSVAILTREIYSSRLS